MIDVRQTSRQSQTALSPVEHTFAISTSRIATPPPAPLWGEPGAAAPDPAWGRAPRPPWVGECPHTPLPLADLRQTSGRPSGGALTFGRPQVNAHVFRPPPPCMGTSALARAD